jgi:Na+-translocating ferredoxin:NAD+ oxidoreductase subunit B
MQSDVFTQLREQLDQYSIGFPATESGVELKILKKLFTEEEARMFLNLSMMLEPADSVAKRTSRGEKEVSDLLERMTEKGLLFRTVKGEAPHYCAVAFVVGIYEFQLDRMDRELAELMERYFKEAFEHQAMAQSPPMRTIPVSRAINVSWPVAPYEDARAIIRTKDRIAVAKCICRVQQGLLEHPCDKPLEVCLSFGSHADFYVKKGMGRWITQEEALKVLDQSEEAGLVPQPFNAQNPGGMCNCCGDCCGVLRALRQHPTPAEMVTSSYHAVVDPDLCTGCETCMDRCQMDAIRVDGDGKAAVDLHRCIGCGLCVTTCPTEALRLDPRPQGERKAPPATAKETMMQLAKERGKTLIPLALMKSG